MSKFEELKNSLWDSAQISIIQRIDNALFSHGGLTTEFVKWNENRLLKEYLVETGVSYADIVINEITLVGIVDVAMMSGMNRSPGMWQIV